MILCPCELSVMRVGFVCLPWLFGCLLKTYKNSVQNELLNFKGLYSVRTHIIECCPIVIKG